MSPVLYCILQKTVSEMETCTLEQAYTFANNHQVAVPEPFTMSNKVVAQDACRVCFNNDAEADNCIVYCEECDFGAHQKCYDIRYVPIGDWYCAKCKMDEYVLDEENIIQVDCEVFQDVNFSILVRFMYRFSVFALKIYPIAMMVYLLASFGYQLNMLGSSGCVSAKGQYARVVFAAAYYAHAQGRL